MVFGPICHHLAVVTLLMLFINLVYHYYTNFFISQTNGLTRDVSEPKIARGLFLSKTGDPSVLSLGDPVRIYSIVSQTFSLYIQGFVLSNDESYPHSTVY